MHPIVIDIPEQTAVSAESEQPIEQSERIRVYFGPDIEIVLTPETADRVADALIDVLSDARPVVDARRRA